MEYWTWGKIKSDGYTSQFQQGFMEITPDAGIPFRMQRFTDVGSIFQGTFILDKNTKKDFESWYKFNIRQGSIPFKFYDCEVEQYRTTRIIENPTYNTVSNMFSISIKMMFDSEIFNVSRYLKVNNGSYLLVNNGKRLIVNKKLRV